MITVYLFDWGDTLMVDYPNVKGKMCDWETVTAVHEAKETLAELSKHAKLYIATGAADSSEIEIKKAFERVGLSQFLSGYFCKSNLGYTKGTPEFLPSILSKLKVPENKVAMVGDNFDKDIKPAISAGIRPYWFTTQNTESIPNNVFAISHLKALCEVK